MNTVNLIPQEVLETLVAKAHLGNCQGLEKADQTLMNMLTGKETVTTKKVVKLVKLNESGMKKNVYREILLMYVTASAWEYNISQMPRYFSRRETNYNLSMLKQNLLIKLNKVCR